MKRLTWKQQEQVMRAARNAEYVFLRNGWTYGLGRTTERPDAAMLAITIQDTYQSALDCGNEVSSGRFVVRPDPVIDGEWEILLTVSDEPSEDEDAENV